MFGKINKKLGITLKVNNFCHKKNCPVGRGGFRDNISGECRARGAPKALRHYSAAGASAAGASAAGASALGLELRRERRVRPSFLASLDLSMFSL